MNDFDDLLLTKNILVANLLWVEFDKTLKNNNLGSGQIFVLIALWQNDGLGQTELAQKLKVSPPTVNKMIKTMSQNGLVRIEQNTEDRRKSKIFLTEPARNLKDSAYNVCRQLDEEIYSDFTDTEKLILTQILEKMKLVLVR